MKKKEVFCIDCNKFSNSFFDENKACYNNKITKNKSPITGNYIIKINEYNPIEKNKNLNCKDFIKKIDIEKKLKQSFITKIKKFIGLNYEK